ncbi:hypothetical protein FRC01_014552 [Tulasnella sp. 417]|nr:hypothetical protein FRC01_014552 [Tulasnella sp. 417]
MATGEQLSLRKESHPDRAGADYVNILGNLQQSGFVIYQEEVTRIGPDDDHIWRCWIHVHQVLPPLLDVVPGHSNNPFFVGGVEIQRAASFWCDAANEGEARRLASRNVLYMIQYYEAGNAEDVLTAAGQFVSQPANAAAGAGAPGN